MIINYPNNMKRIKLPDRTCVIGRQLALGHPKSLAAAIMKGSNFQDAIYKEACSVIQKELQSLCSLQWRRQAFQTGGALHSMEDSTVAQRCNTQTQKRIHKRKTKYTNAKPNTQNQIHERKTKYTNAKENT